MLRFFSKWSPFWRRTEEAECKPRASSVALAISTAETELVWLQSLAVWESPLSSIMALIAVNVGVWAVRVLQLRVMFVLAAVALFRLARTEWRQRIWPEIRVPPPVPEDPEPWTEVTTSTLTAPELIRYVERIQRAGDNLVTSVANFRRTTPLLFVVVANLCWAALYVVSRCVSGAVLAQLLLSLLLTVPALLLHWLPPGTSDRLRLLAEEATRTLQSWGMMGADCESEFVPESSPETRAYLDAMADIINGRESTPEYHEAFSSGLEAAPDIADSEDTDDDLAPSLDSAAHFNFAGGASVVDSNRPGGSKEATSAAGGSLEMAVASQAAAALGAQALSSATQLLSGAGRLVSAVYSAQQEAQQRDSDSDFELIDDDELRT